MVLDGEYGSREYARRLLRLARGRGLDPQRVMRDVHYVYSAGWSLRSAPAPTKENRHRREYQDGLVALVDDLRDGRIEPSLLVVDPMRNHLGADGDENSARDVVALCTTVNALRSLAGCPVILPHHLNQAGSTAGSRALPGRVDLIIEGTDEAQPWYSARGRTIRDGDPIAQRWSAEIRHEHDKDDSRAATTLTLRTAGQRGPSRPALPKSAARVLDALAAGGMTASRLRQLLVMGGSAAKQALEHLEQAGLVTRQGEVWEVSPTGLSASLQSTGNGVDSCHPTVQRPPTVQLETNPAEPAAPGVYPNVDVRPDTWTLRSESGNRHPRSTSESIPK